jgi:hypothetical protein
VIFVDAGGVDLLQISLMCGIKTTNPMENYLEIDEWLEFEFPTSHIIYLRRFIETIIKKKLLSPTNALNESDEAALNALARILILEDRHANLVIPVGIKQKPKFFELNRVLDSDQADHRPFNNPNNFRYNRYHPPPIQRPLRRRKRHCQLLRNERLPRLRQRQLGALRQRVSRGFESEHRDSVPDVSAGGVHGRDGRKPVHFRGASPATTRLSHFRQFDFSPDQGEAGEQHEDRIRFEQVGVLAADGEASGVAR